MSQADRPTCRVSLVLERSAHATTGRANPVHACEGLRDWGRRAYQRHRARQRQQKEDDRRTIEAMDQQIRALQAERAELARRVDVLQKVTSHPQLLVVFTVFGLRRSKVSHITARLAFA